MKFNLKTILQYVISLSFGGALFWWQYRDKNFQELYTDFKEINLFWIGMSVASAMVSHWSRAYRWKIALKPFGLRINTFRALLAVFVSYFASMFVPRIGEFLRSGILKRTDDAPVNISFGAIIAERAIDIFILFLLTASVFLIEFDKIGSFVLDKLRYTSNSMVLKVFILALVGFAGILALFIFYKYRSRFKEHFIFNKFKDFTEGIKKGLLSIGDLSNYDRVRYIALSLTIWLMYFLMTYFFFFSLEETQNLGLRCALTTLIMAGIGTAIPTPGGIGSYHIFVTFSLSVYGLDKAVGENLALLMHTTQSLILVVLGAISLVITLIIVFRKKKKDFPSKGMEVDIAS